MRVEFTLTVFTTKTKANEKGAQETCGGDIFITWIVVMIIQVYTFVQTQQIVNINYVQCFFTNYI